MQGKAKQPTVLLNQLVDSVTEDAKEEVMPTWRARTVLAKALLITKALYMEAGEEDLMNAVYRRDVDPLVRRLLAGTCMDINDVLYEEVLDG